MRRSRKSRKFGKRNNACKLGKERRRQTRKIGKEKGGREGNKRVNKGENEEIRMERTV